MPQNFTLPTLAAEQLKLISHFNAGLYRRFFHFQIETPPQNRHLFQ